jgi:predicted RNA-binding Zn-ribbon protein involved in translation (DUF1610 family)
MRKCTSCGKELPLMKTRRTWKERYLTRRNKSKYECAHCHKITIERSKCQ